MYWRIEECRGCHISMQSGLPGIGALFTVSIVLRALPLLPQCIIWNWNALLDCNAISSSGISANHGVWHRIMLTDICRPPGINAISTLWSTQPLAFFNIVNRWSGIIALQCTELSYIPSKHLLCACAANMPLTALKTFHQKNSHLISPQTSQHLLCWHVMSFGTFQKSLPMLTALQQNLLNCVETALPDLLKNSSEAHPPWPWLSLLVAQKVLN